MKEKWIIILSHKQQRDIACFTSVYDSYEDAEAWLLDIFPKLMKQEHGFYDHRDSEYCYIIDYIIE